MGLSSASIFPRGRAVWNLRNIAGPVLVALAACAGPRGVQFLNDHAFLGTPGEPEWEEFGARSTGSRRLDLRFQGNSSPSESTLIIEQSDVKQRWTVELNGRKLGELHLMEHPLRLALPVPAGALKDGANVLSIIPPKVPDDIVIGGVELRQRPLAEVLSEVAIDVEVVDSETGRDLPCRITVFDRWRVLLPVRAAGRGVAFRPGVVYTPDGKVRLGLPGISHPNQPASYFVVASRGFEYGVAQADVEATAGHRRTVRLELRREVPTPGLVACDTHIHTHQYSGHGDASADERMVTLAGEGIELPIATEHNQHTGYEADAVRTGMRAHFTPVLGNEVTTKKGHFNVFPVRPGATVPDAREEHWPKLMDSIRGTGARVIILNHPRDLHSNFRPFDPVNFDAGTGENKRGFEFEFNALEVVNSGALQSDPMQLFRDWFALLNYGYRVAAVGGSDSHDVSRYIVGQGRTYVEANDADPGKIDVEEAVRSFREGRVSVSLGLLTRLDVKGDEATVTVLGPSWIRADGVTLYANGLPIADAGFTSGKPVEKFKRTWTVPKGTFDVWLVAVASGPGVADPAWAIPKPYQPTSKKWEPRVLGSSAVVRIDRDGDGKFTAPREYAKALVERLGKDPERLREALKEYDAAVAAQVAALTR